MAEHNTKDFYFIFGVHNHQPVGNFDHVFKNAFDSCYRPFLDMISRHPSFRLSIHFSGPLLEYMEKNESGCWNLLKEMANRGQVELLSGGFYEPILTIIPERDRLGQLKMMNDYLAENFGQKPRGLWLTERVWEPNLPKTISQAGLEYLFLDEEHFHYAGISDINTTYITEEEGYSVRIFPIDKNLRYLVPFQPLEKVAQAFNEIKKGGGSAFLADDGEKFGLWPGTKSWVYEQGWLDRFLKFIEQNDIKTMTCSEYMDKSEANSLVYFPPCSYEEMMAWVLEPDDYEHYRKLRSNISQEERRFLRGGLFRDFFIKYPEARNLRSRMLLASEKVKNSTNATAIKELYKGQCNDAYWHGIFGGLYLPHLREAVYHHLIEAENKAGVAQEPCYFSDLDADGKEEAISRGTVFNVFVKPHSGGTIYEIDCLSKARNLTNTLSRRRESYHTLAEKIEATGQSIHELRRQIPEESKHLLVYDAQPRYSAIDRFFVPGLKAGNVEHFDTPDISDFQRREYLARAGDARLELTCQGKIILEAEQIEIALNKSIENTANGIKVNWTIRPLNTEKNSTRKIIFGSEWNFLVFPGELEVKPDFSVNLKNEKIVISPEQASGCIVYPVKTISQSEENFDIIHQGFCVIFLFEISLSADEGSVCNLYLRETNESR